ncbi:phage portal protein family protein [Arthrobacter sp. KNU40]|uniref:phage portal protein family protein n=1 Tax=Arthrobacter sp. KNU40 TaxID=3447965 RepID=UPI003F60DD5B
MASNSNRKRSQLVTPEMGDSGTHIFAGVITGEEYNFNLVGRRALKVWEEMRRSDASVGASLKAIKYPIKATKFFAAPASDDAADVEVSDFVHWNLFSRLKWKKVLGEILTYLEMGYAIFEMVFEVEIVDGVERIVLTKLGFRKQTGLESWQAGPDLPGITFRKSNGQSVSIPLEKLIVFTNEQEGDNYEGVSILRTAYKHWFYVDKFDQIDAIGHERHSLGVPKIKYPRTATDPEREAARNVVRNLRANEEGYVEEPEGWDISFMDMQAHSLKDIGPSRDRHDRQITKNVLAQFLELGTGGASGARAVSEDQHILLNQSIESVLDYIADTLGYVVKTLVDLNFNVDKYPTIKHGDVNQKDVTALAAAVEKFVSSGLLTPTEADEDHVRQLVEFPKLTDEAKAVRAKNLETAAKAKVAADTSDAQRQEVADGDPADVPIPTEPSKLKTMAGKVSASLTRLLYGDKSRAA